MEKIIEKLEKAMGPGSALDHIIHAAIYQTPVCMGTLPHYTASLDAALILVPEDAWVKIEYPKTPAAYHHSRKEGRIIKAGFDLPRPPYSSFGCGATPAIALCIAALKTHATAEEAGNA